MVFSLSVENPGEAIDSTGLYPSHGPVVFLQLVLLLSALQLQSWVVCVAPAAVLPMHDACSPSFDVQFTGVPL